MSASQGLMKEMMQELARTNDRMNGIEKSIIQLGREKADSAQIIRKALSDGRGGTAATMGFDGADTLGLIRHIGGPRQKALGMGQYLTAVHAAASGKDPVQVEKALEKMGCRAVHKTALAEGSGATGGYTVPVQFYADLMRLVAEESFFRALCFMVPMQSRTILVPALDHSKTPPAGTSAFFGGIAASWQPEGSLTESEPIFRQVELVARDLVFYTLASNQLLQDNAVALDTLLTTLFKEAMAWFIDYYLLQGNGAAQPLGCLNAPCALKVLRNTGSSVKLIDLATMQAELLMSGWKNAIWVMHQSVLPQLISMTDSANGRLVWVNQYNQPPDGSAMASAFPITVLGRPVYFTEKVPALGTTGDVMLIDPSKILLGDRLALQIEVSSQVKFLTNQMAWRVIQRWDAQPWLNAPITLADGVKQVSPVIILQ